MSLYSDSPISGACLESRSAETSFPTFLCYRFALVRLVAKMHEEKRCFQWSGEREVLLHHLPHGKALKPWKLGFFSNRDVSEKAGAGEFLVRNSSSTSNSYEVITELNHKISGHGCVPQHIQRPPYAETGLVPDSPKSIEIKTDEQIAAMKVACRTARKVINITRDYIKVGVTTEDINKVVHQAAISFGAYPSPLNYKGFPKSVCTSVNNVAVHGIPDSRALKNGDIISVDVSVFIGGVHGDLCETFVVGSTDKEGQRLIDTCKQCLDAAVSICSPGTRYSWIGNTISFIANKKGFSVCSQLAGHGVGSVFHGPPEILHTVNFNPGKMERGVTFTIEPVLCEGSPKIEILEDGWTVVTEDGKRAAQFEHTVLITDTGVEVLTADEED